MRGEGNVDMGTFHEQGAKINRLGITTMQMLITLFMIATMCGDAFTAGAPPRPKGIPLTASEKYLLLKCEEIARVRGYDSVTYTSQCRALRPLGARSLVEKL
jgi:hypothetical protein